MTGTEERRIDGRQRADAALVWAYHHMGHELRPCDVAIGLGSHDLGVPAYAAELFSRGLFNTVVFSGGPNTTAPGRFPEGEAVRFAEDAVALGVPESAVLREPRARNTGQNIAFSREVLKQAGVKMRSVMLISMPYMERRAYATCRQVWPEVQVVCASAPLSMEDYARTVGGEQHVIDHMMGDLQRVMEYPARGFAVEQVIPADVLSAYQRLRADGFTSRMLG
ncbi:YdcF family protein [Kitasatospora sp. NPDC051853]|uniref:YdcF family protein n=1 Tax=Kitasatospora sp. NPDC051853 TaxID=3364058 RepID=UPI0037B902E2